MGRAYSPKVTQQFLWESCMESGFEEGIESYSQHWDCLHAAVGSRWRCQQAWGRFFSLRPVLGCALKASRNQDPALQGAPAWKRHPEAKGKGTAGDRRATDKVTTLPRKAQSVGNGKKGSVSKRNKEKCGLRRSWSQLGCIYYLDLELLAGLFF